MIRKITTALIISVTCSPLWAQMVDPRCESAGDSLDLDLALRRNKWTFKCFPSYRGMIKEDGTMTSIDLSSGQRMSAYLSFAIAEAVSSVDSSAISSASSDTIVHKLEVKDPWEEMNSGLIQSKRIGRSNHSMIALGLNQILLIGGFTQDAARSVEIFSYTDIDVNNFEENP